MPVISLLTDFGLSDPYVGIMKGVILCVNPSAQIVDLTHGVPAQDLLEASYVILSAYPFFPPGTVHVVVVDPGVGSGRSIVCVELNGHRFLAPDNGVLTQVFNHGEIQQAVYVENTDYFLKPLSHTFHGRDIFAPVAAHLSMGLNTRELGAKISPDDLTRLEIPEPEFKTETVLMGTVISIDRFGNLVTNIQDTHIRSILKNAQEDQIEIDIGNHRILSLSKSYDAVNAHQPLAILGSRRFLEISVNCGNAREVMHANKGDRVTVSLVRASTK